MKTTQKNARRKSPKKIKSAKEKAGPSVLSAVEVAAEKIFASAENLFNSRPADVVSALKDDHESLRNYLDTLKDTHENMTKRRRAYVAFSDLLKSHSLAEETAVYNTANKIVGREMHIRVAEGFVEHKLAEDLMKRIEKAKDSRTWSAHANVLAEIVEHHLDEEERELFPKIRRATTAKTDNEMLLKFLTLRAKTQKIVSKKSAGALE